MSCKRIQQLINLHNTKRSYPICITEIDSQLILEWEKRISSIQTNFLERLKWYMNLHKCVDSWIKNVKTIEDVEKWVHIVKTDKKNGLLGSGAYGDVYKAILRLPPCQESNSDHLPMALKIQPLNVNDESFDDKLKNIFSEIQNNEKINQLIMDQKTNHFLFTVGSMVVPIYKPKFYEPNEFILSSYMTYTISEYANGNLKELLQPLIDKSQTKEIFTVFVQVLFAILHLSEKTNMIHNDLYLRNILYNKCDTLVKFEYQVLYQDKFWYANSFPINVIVKIADFGYLNHDTPPQKQQIWTNEQQIYNVPIRFLKGMNLFAKDILSFVMNMDIFFRNFVGYNHFVYYFQKIIHFICKSLKQRPEFLNKPQDLIELYVCIFEPSFMGPVYSLSGFSFSPKKLDLS